MINKKTFLFNKLEDVLKYKIGADPKNITYRIGSFNADATISQGEPDISYYSEILIRETNQIWRCNQFWLNDVKRSSDNDLVTERAERETADTLLQKDIDNLTQKSNDCEQYQQLETQERKESDEELRKILENQQLAISSLGLRVDGLAGVLITMEEYRSIKPKLFQTYFIARDEIDKKKLKCWRIYLRSQLIGEFESNGFLTMPKFPMRFPFRFA